MEQRFDGHRTTCAFSFAHSTYHCVQETVKEIVRTVVVNYIFLRGTSWAFAEEYLVGPNEN
jgi:hypothetical protein